MSQALTKGKTRTIEVFRPGTFRSMQGEVLDFSADILRASAAAYDPELAPAPAVVGHPATDAPAYGWAVSFSYDDRRQRLLADVGELETQFADAVAAGRYKRISLSFFSPQAPANPKPGTWYPKHIGFLGAAAPAVPGLKPVSFAGDQTGVVEFVSGDQTSSLFRSLRDFFIETFGLETADQVLPSWQIDWMAEAEGREDRDEPAAPSSTASPSSASPASASPASNASPASSASKKPLAADKPRDAAFAEREAWLARREEQAAAREKQAIHDVNAGFADSLIHEGRLLPVQRERLIAMLNAVDGGGLEASFADGRSEPAGAVLRALLRELPRVVPFGQSAPASPDSTQADFVVPPGTTASGADLQLLARAQSYQRAHNVSLNEAVKAVSRQECS